MTRISRRGLIKGAAAGTAALVGSRLLELPYLMAQAAPTGDKAKLRTAVIGCGGRGTDAMVPPAAAENLVALIDPDAGRIANAIKRAKKVADDNRRPFDETKIKTYSDYRKFFDEMAKEVDAVFIATPNHHHALPALLAMQRGIAAFVEKPMAYDIHETRLMAEYSQKYKVATQMGNQGHTQGYYHVLYELIHAGAIGNVTEVYSWCDRQNGGVGPRPRTMPVPAGLNWDQWIGPAPYRDYHPDKITLDKEGKERISHMHPHEWHHWHDFGGGSLGNMGCHILDGAHWALNLNGPSSFEVEEVNGGSDERYPIGTRIRWEFPQRGDLPPVKLFWYDGKSSQSKSKEQGQDDSVAASAQNFPPLLQELKKQFKDTDEKFDSNGTLYVGDKGMMYTGTYGGGVRILPKEKHDEYMKANGKPKELLRRSKGGHTTDFLNGIRDPNHIPLSNFVEAAKLTEFVLQGCTSLRLPNQGLGTKVQWNGTKSTNSPEFNALIQRKYREGWSY